MIKGALDRISSEPSSKKKIEILKTITPNGTFRQVLYLANSNKIKFHIKKIPDYTMGRFKYTLPDALVMLVQIYRKVVTGNEAIELLTDILSGVVPNDAYVIERIIDKDLKIGMLKKSINKVFPKLIETTPYMGARSYSEKLARDILNEGIAYSEIKEDGRYCNALIFGGVAKLESRSGEITLLTGSKVLRELSNFDDCVLNGELTIPGVDRNTSNGIINSIITMSGKIHKGGIPDKDLDKLYKKHGMTYAEALDRIVYTVWDQLTLTEYDNKSSMVSRRMRLNSLVDSIEESKATRVLLIEGKIVKTYKEAMAHFQETLARGLEGTILKSADGVWVDGKPNWQIKMKLEMDLDMRIIGFRYGTKGTKNEHVISSLIVESDCGKVVTKPGAITESDMEDITKRQKELLGTIIEMKCSGLSHDSSGNYSTLYPVFKSLRGDKDTCDSLESIMEIENMAKSLS